MPKSVILAAITTHNIEKIINLFLQSKPNNYAYVTMTSQQRALDYFDNKISLLFIITSVAVLFCSGVDCESHKRLIDSKCLAVMGNCKISDQLIRISNFQKAVIRIEIRINIFPSTN